MLGEASAHHVLGLPHYKYGSEYPQIPFVEVPAQSGPHEISFTYFPGTPEPGQRVRFKIYVRNRDTGKPFRNPLTAQVYRKRFLRAAVAEGAPLAITVGRGPQRNDYKFYATFEAAEAYEVRVKFVWAEGTETIPFPVTVGQTDDRPLLLGTVLTLALTVVVVAVINRRRRARAGADPAPDQEAAP